MLKIIIAENNATVCQGVKRILRKAFYDAEIDEAANGEELLTTIANSQYSLVIVDVLTPGIKITDAVKQTRTHYPHLPVLILSMYPFNHYAVNMLKAGASGYLSTHLVPEKLVSAVHCVLRGETFPSQQAIMAWH